MQNFLTLEQIDETANAVRARTDYKPRIGMILGSGLNALAESVQKPDIIPFGDLPHFPVSTVFGHAGRLVIGELENVTVYVMQGRIHFYEGYSMQPGDSAGASHEATGHRNHVRDERGAEA